MQLTSEIFTAQIEGIDANGAHLFWADKPLESQIKSINEFGQASPVLITDSENGLELIAGHARLAVLRDTGQTVLARMVTDANDVEKGLLYLADNGHRILNDGMRLAALKYFAPLMDEKALKADILPRMEIKPKSKDAKLLLAWLDMDATWQALLESGNVPLAAATPLARMDEADRAAVEPLFTDFSWSRSNAVNMLNWLFETSKMVTCPVQKVMQQAGMTDIMKQGLSPKDTIARLNSAAKQARYPELDKLQSAFNAASGEITTGTRWRMSQPNNFETGGSELVIQVKDAAQLAKSVEELKIISTSPAWEKIWKLGSNDD